MTAAGVLRAVRAAAVVAMLAACTPALAAAPVLQGGCTPKSSPYLPPSAELGEARITYCQQGDASMGVVESSPFPAGTRRVVLLAAGYPDGGRVRILAVSVDGSARADVVRDPPGDVWKRIVVDVPEAVRATPFTLRVVDGSPDAFGWAGIGFPVAADRAVQWGGAARIGLDLALAHLWLVLVALCLPPAWRPGGRVAAALVVLGVAGMAVFLGYVLAPALGRTLAGLSVLAPAVVVAGARTRRAWPAVRDVSRVLAPATVLAALVLWIGLYPFAWTGADWQTPASRWRDMPMDNWLPLLFAEMLARGELARPMVGDWLSSDRPPLQAGLFLLFRDVLAGHAGLAYQVLSTWLQALVLVPVAMLAGTVARPRDRAIVVFVVALSALVVVNGLFVWPKLLAATYCALYHLLVFQRRGALPGRHAVAAGVVAGLALLAHGGALFALVGSTLAFLAIRRRAALRAVLAAAGGGAAIYLPWVLYQRIVDPPGDRLLKWHFAGEVEPTTRPLGSVLADAWGGLTPAQWLDGRLANLGAMADGSLRFFADVLRLAGDPGSHATIRPMIESSFFAAGYSLWFFTPLLLPVLVAFDRLGRRGAAGPAPRATLPAGLAAATAIALAAWVLVMFVPASTVVHQGSHFSLLALHLLVMLGVLRVAPPLFAILAAGNFALFLALYAFDRAWVALPWPSAYAAATLGLAGGLFIACRQAAGAATHPPEESA